MIKITILTILILLSVPGYTAPSEAEYNKLHETWNLKADGSQEYRCYKELTIFTHTAMNGTYGETFIVYNPQFQELKIHDSYTRQKEGNLVRTPANAFVEVLPRAATDAPAYNHLKEMVIVHTGLELGATIVLDYSIISQPGYLPETDICQTLQQSSPVRDYTLTFCLPVNKTAHYETLATKVQPVITRQDGTQQIQWNFRNMTALSQAPEVIPKNGDIPGITFTTYASPAEALQTIYGQFDKTPDEGIKTMVAQLTGKCKTDTEKLYAIRDFVAGQIADCPLTPSSTGYCLRPASRIIQTAYGTGLEKLNLLNLLLNTCGIQAEPAAAYNSVQNPENCGLSSVREYVIITRVDGKDYLLNPQQYSKAAENCPFLLKLKDGEIIRQASPENKIDYKARIVLSPTEMTTEITASFSQNNIPYQNHFTNELIPGIQNPLVNTTENMTQIQGTAKTSLQKTDGYILLNLPSTNKGIEQYPYTRYNSKRQINLQLPYTTREDYNYEVLLPSDMQVASPDKEKKIDNPVGSLLISMRSDGKSVSIHRMIQLKKQLITPADYSSFRELIIEWNHPNNRQILVTTKD